LHHMHTLVTSRQRDSALVYARHFATAGIDLSKERGKRLQRATAAMHNLVGITVPGGTLPFAWDLVRNGIVTAAGYADLNTPLPSISSLSPAMIDRVTSLVDQPQHLGRVKDTFGDVATSLGDPRLDISGRYIDRLIDIVEEFRGNGPGNQARTDALIGARQGLSEELLGHAMNNLNQYVGETMLHNMLGRDTPGYSLLMEHGMAGPMPGASHP